MIYKSNFKEYITTDSIGKIIYKSTETNLTDLRKTLDTFHDIKTNSISKSYSIYDKNGNIVEKKGNRILWKITYLKYDSEGNWTSDKEIINDKIFFYSRDIEYYE
jgi:flagellar hook assembly protein FlgD